MSLLPVNHTVPQYCQEMECKRYTVPIPSTAKVCGFCFCKNLKNYDGYGKNGIISMSWLKETNCHIYSAMRKKRHPQMATYIKTNSSPKDNQCSNNKGQRATWRMEPLSSATLMISPPTLQPSTCAPQEPVGFRWDTHVSNIRTIALSHCCPLRTGF